MVTSLGLFPVQLTPSSTADPGTCVIACKASALQRNSITPTITTNCCTYMSTYSTAKLWKMNLPDDGEGALSGGTVECVWPEQTSCLQPSE